MHKKITRRQAIAGASAAVMLPVANSFSKNFTATKINNAPVSERFLHGVASGDPDQTSVVLWTRVSGFTEAVEVEWYTAKDREFNDVIAKGKIKTQAARDYTVKVIAGDLEPAQSIFYKFIVDGVTSPIGQTHTLPVGHVEELVLAVATCSNFPFGYFNAYEAIAQDDSIDLVLHLGDYIYEYGVEGYGGTTGKRIGRYHEPKHEIVTLADYRQRHAQYKADECSRAMHARHPLAVIWDDHESANNPWQGGAQNHQPEEGSWLERRSVSLQAYYEWLPIRDPAPGRAPEKYWRHYKFGDLASIITLESRHTGRSEQIHLKQYESQLTNAEDAKKFYRSTVGAKDRNMLSAEMESFLKTELEESVAAGRTWRIIGNQSVMAKTVVPKLEDEVFEKLENTLSGRSKKLLEFFSHFGDLGIASDMDSWDGYPAARERFYDLALAAKVSDLLVLSGDSHSFWANTLFDEHDHAMGVELGATGISSPRSLLAFGDEGLQRYDELSRQQNKEVHWTDGRHRGFIKLTLKHEGAHADFVAVSNVDTRIYNTRIVQMLDIVKRKGTLQFT